MSQGGSEKGIGTDLDMADAGGRDLVMECPRILVIYSSFDQYVNWGMRQTV
jgi:hypothetical protein